MKKRKGRHKTGNGDLHGYWVEDSSNVAFVGWDAEDNLYVRYKSGGYYMYKEVSRQRAVATALAKSVGTYINAKIKPHHQAVKVL